MPDASDSTVKYFAFGNMVLDGEARELRAAGQAVDLEPRVFDLLELLASQPEHTFTKDEIAESLWPKRIISDSVIAQCIRKARQATGDTVSAQKVIKTVHGVGYRFVAPLAAPDGRPLTSARNGQTDKLRAMRPTLWVISGFLLIALLAWLPSRPVFEQSPRPIIIAALPAAETGALPESLALGLEALLSRTVADHSRIQIISTSRTQRTLEALGLDPDLDEKQLLEALNNALGADYLMQAQVRQLDQNYQASARLIGPGGVLEELAPPAGDLATMVRGFSLALARELGTSWRETEGIPVLSGDPFVDEAYARALNALLMGDNQAAALLFESVLMLHPELVYARYELGNAHWQLGDNQLAAEHYRIAHEVALERNDDRLAGHTSSMLGVLAWQQGAYEEAEAWYAGSLEHYDKIGDLHAAASSLGNLGNLADSLGQLERAADLHSLAGDRFRAVGDQVGESITYTNLAVISRLRSRMHEAYHQQSTAAAMQRKLGIGSLLVRSLTYLAAIQCELGHCRDAVMMLEEAQSMATEQGNQHGLAEVELERARLAIGRLQPVTAATYAESARNTFAEQKFPAGELLALNVLIESALMQNDLPVAGSWLEQAEQLDTRISKPRDYAQRQLLKSRLELAQADRDAALVILQPLLDDPDRVIAAQAQSVMADIFWQQDQPMLALQSWQEALSELEAFDDPRVRAGIRLQMARALIAMNRPDDAAMQLAHIRNWNRDDAGARIAQARLHLASNNPDEARSELGDLTTGPGELPVDPELDLVLSTMAIVVSEPGNDQ